MKTDHLEKPLLIAHRGFSSRYPENTPAAFKAALDHGAIMVEFDVALTKDRSLVVIHDSTLDRTTSGSGKVAETTLSEIKSLDAGSWFDKAFHDQRIPELFEVLDIIGGKSLINIEIKEEYLEESAAADSIEYQVLNLVKEKQLTDSVVISSFEIRYLERLHAEPDIPALAFISRYPADEAVIEKCRELQLYSWNAWHEILTREQVDAMHDAGVKVFTFTVDSAEHFEKVKSMGVDGIFTNNIIELERIG